MLVFIGMETSGMLRRAFQARGHETYSGDLLPSEDGGEEMAYSSDSLPLGRHLVGDVFDTLENLRANDMWPDLAIFHPDCTYLTSSAEWAYADPDFDRYPGVGYHQRVKPGTLTGAARREAREHALDDVRKILALPIKRKVVENPIGAISRVRRFSQIIQPNRFGHDASKATGLILIGVPKLRPTKWVEPRSGGMPLFGGDGGPMRWANQTDNGQNRLSPGPDRWKDRARTYQGIADAMAEQWG